VTFPRLAAIAVLLVLAGAAGPGAAESEKSPAPIGRVVKMRGGLSELTLYRRVEEGQFVVDRREQAEQTKKRLDAGIDIISEQPHGILEVRSNGQTLYLDKREVDTTIMRRSAERYCDPIKAQTKLAQDLRTQGLGNDCK